MEQFSVCTVFHVHPSHGYAPDASDLTLAVLLINYFQKLQNYVQRTGHRKAGSAGCPFVPWDKALQERKGKNPLASTDHYQKRGGVELITRSSHKSNTYLNLGNSILGALSYSRAVLSGAAYIQIDSSALLLVCKAKRRFKKNGRHPNISIPFFSAHRRWVLWGVFSHYSKYQQGCFFSLMTGAHNWQKMG